jgi:hypothetical protein
MNHYSYLIMAEVYSKKNVVELNKIYMKDLHSCFVRKIK